MLQKVETELMEKLAEMYVHAEAMHRVDPASASERKQRKIRKWIDKQYNATIRELPDEVAEQLSGVKSDAEILAFLKECRQQIRELEEDGKRRFDEVAAEFDRETEVALKEFAQRIWIPGMKTWGTDIELVVADGLAYRQTLILKNATVEAEGQLENSVYLHTVELKKEETGYSLFCRFEDGEPMVFKFETAETRVEVFNCTAGSWLYDNPWFGLQSMVSRLLTKAELPGGYCSEKEKELLPLIREIGMLEYWFEGADDREIAFPNLKAISARHRYRQVMELLEKMEALELGRDKYNGLADRLIRTLSEQKYEPMWREIFEKIRASQQDYPNMAERFCSSDILQNTRSKIQQLMESHGYAGTYPDFVKTGPMKGIHLEESYGLTYFIGMEKRVQYRIHCSETFDEDDGLLGVQFLCGTAILKKGETVEDIYACMFNAKGRRLIHTVFYDVPLVESEELNSEPDDLELRVRIAVKRAELKKLTKEERKGYWNPGSGCGTFLGLFVVAGGMFSILFTPMMMLYGMLMLALFGEFSEIPALFTDFPWLQMFAFAWIGFGGAMGLVTVLARRK